MSGRPMSGQRREAQGREHDKIQERRRVDAEHVAEQERRGLRRPCGVEMQEQEAQPQRQRQHHADRHVALGELFAEQPHADAGNEGEADEAGERRKAEQHRPGRAGEADMGERMAGEGLAAQHKKEADRRPPAPPRCLRRRRRCA